MPAPPHPDPSSLVFHSRPAYSGDSVRLFAPWRISPGRTGGQCVAGEPGGVTTSSRLAACHLVTRAGNRMRACGRPRRTGAGTTAGTAARAARAATPAGCGPFAAGALGYFAYDLARRLHRLPALASDAEGLPEMASGFTTAPGGRHRERSCRLWANDDAAGREWRSASCRLAGRAGWDGFRSPAKSNPAQPGSYRQGFRPGAQFIRAGDCYQVNLALPSPHPAGATMAALPGAASAQSGSIFGLAQFPLRPGAVVLAGAFSLGARRLVKPPDQGHARAATIRGRRAAQWRISRQRQGPRREPDDRGPAAQRLGQVCTPAAVNVTGLFTLESYARCIIWSAPCAVAWRGARRHWISWRRRSGRSITGAPSCAPCRSSRTGAGTARVYCGASAISATTVGWIPTSHPHPDLQRQPPAFLAGGGWWRIPGCCGIPGMPGQGTRAARGAGRVSRQREMRGMRQVARAIRRCRFRWPSSIC